MKRDAHMIAEGALMTAMVGVALFLNRQLAGVLEYALYWLLSFPILIYTIRYGIKKACICAASMLLLGGMIALPTTIFYLACAIVTGIAYGCGIRRKWSNQSILCVVGCLTLISYFITMILFAGIFGYDPQQDIELAIIIGNAFSIQGVNIAQIALVFSVLMVFMIAFLQTICIHLFAVLIMKRLKMEVPKLKSIFDLRLPKIIGYISICIWLLFLLRNVIKLEGNILLVLLSAYGMMSVVMVSECIVSVMSVSILLRKRSFLIIATFMIVLAMLWSVSRNIVIGYGIYSCISDLRGKIKRGVMNGTFRKS